MLLKEGVWRRQEQQDVCSLGRNQRACGGGGIWSPSGSPLLPVSLAHEKWKLTAEGKGWMAWEATWTPRLLGDLWSLLRCPVSCYRTHLSLRHFPGLELLALCSLARFQLVCGQRQPGQGHLVTSEGANEPRSLEMSSPTG